MLNSKIFIQNKIFEGAEKYGYVPSKSEPGKEHLVYKKQGDWYCDCIAGMMNKECSHIKKMMYENGEFGRCFYCGTTAFIAALDEHHVFRRSLRPDLIDDKENLMLLCRKCHDRATNEPQFEEKLQTLWKIKKRTN